MESEDLATPSVEVARFWQEAYDELVNTPVAQPDRSPQLREVLSHSGCLRNKPPQPM